MTKHDLKLLKVGFVRLGIYSENIDDYDFSKEIELLSLGDLLDINILIGSSFNVGHYYKKDGKNMFKFNEDAKDILQLIYL